MVPSTEIVDLDIICGGIIQVLGLTPKKQFSEDQSYHLSSITSKNYQVVPDKFNE